jgi:hypothetical protein
MVVIVVNYQLYNLFMNVEYLAPSKSVPKLAVAIVGMVLLAGVLTIALIRDRIVSPPWREVSITGTGKVPFTPDEASVTLGVHVDSAESAQIALSMLSEKMSTVISGVQKLGINKEDISTQSYNLYPQYFYPENRPPVISGYNADQQLIIRVHGEDGVSNELVEKIIESASASGANQILGVSFSASNIEDLHREALMLAMEDAKSHAEKTASVAGVRLKKVVSWWENPIYVPGMQTQYGPYGYGGGDMGMGGGGSPQVPAGQQEVIIQVNLNYSIK